MENEQATTAVLPSEAAPVDGVGNERERAMSSILKQMTGDEAAATNETALQAPEAGAADEAPIVPEAQPEGEGSPEAVAAQGDEKAEEQGAPEQEERKAKNFRGRWDHLDERERRVVELTTKRGLTLTEASRAVYGDTGGFAAAPGDAQEAPESAVATLDRQIGEQQQRLEALKEQKAAARGDLAEYDQAAEAYLEAREQLRDLRTQRQQAAEQELARAVKAREQAQAVAQEILSEEFPDAVIPGTELFEAFREELAYLKESESPLLRDPQVEYKVARRLARALGYQRSIPAPAVPAVPEKTATARRTIRPLPASGSPVEAPVAALERRVAGARSPGAMLDLMREIGTPFEALLKKAE